MNLKIDYKNTTTYEMNAFVGFPIVEYSTEWLTENGYLTPTKCYFINNELEYENERYADGYDRCIVQNNKRNNIVKQIVDNNKDKKILILTKLIKHGEILNELIRNSKLITSNTNKTDRKYDFNSYKLGEYNILIGSYMLYSTGINIPEIDIIINVSGNKSSISVLQSIGRVMRKTKNKEFAYYYDFYDYGSKYFTSASKQRINILKEFGHEVEIIK